MFDIPIYKAEAEAGLTEVIQANASVAFLSQLEPAQIDESNIKRFLTESKEKFDLDILYPTKSVLVSAVWNKNDDVFGVQELWAARHTPVHKPTNIDHDHKQIVGHITNTWVVDSDGEVVADDTVIDDLPSLIHVCNGAVIYKHYKEEDLRDRATDLIEAIEAGEKYVSMECLFPSFDYAVVTPNNENYTIARNEETAFLTKHLRIYGGEGTFQGYKIGRHLKGMVFSGKGYVDKPANPDSVIFTSDKPDFNFSDAKHKNHFIFENGVNNIMSETPQVSAANLDNSKEKLMADNTNDFYKAEYEKTQAELAELVQTNKKLQDSLANANVEQLQSQITDLTSQVESLGSDKETVAKNLADATSTIEKLNGELEDSAKAQKALEDEIAKAKADKVFADRVSTLVEAGVEKDKAEETASKFANLDDEQFTVVLSSIKELSSKSEFMKKDDDKKKDDKKKDDKKKDKGSEGTELDNALENVEVDASDDSKLGSTEADDESTEVEETRAAMAGFFGEQFGISEDSDE
jgi:outer membrane murein-binding lipoprotein Lpp